MSKETAISDNDGISIIRNFLPEEIIIDEQVNVRPFSAKSGETDLDKQAMSELVESIKAEGQLQPVRVRIDNNERPHLIMGHRRVKAIALINMERDTPLYVQAVDGVADDDHAYRQAMIENIHRKSMSPMDIAYNIQTIRQVHGWDGTKGTKKVADYLKVATAAVTQHEKLLKLDTTLQAKVHEGLYRAQAAIDLADVPVSDRQAVEAEAARLQHEEEADTDGQRKAGKKVGRGGSAKKSKAIKAKHVRKAARKIVADPNVAHPLSKSEIIGFFEDYHHANPAVYGWPDSPHQAFLTYFIEKFAKGKGSARTLDKYYMAIIEHAPKGTKASADDEAVQSEKRARKSA